MCREPLGTDCESVWAFKEKVLSNPRKETPYFDDKEIQDIYESQP